MDIKYIYIKTCVRSCLLYMFVDLLTNHCMGVWKYLCTRISLCVCVCVHAQVLNCVIVRTYVRVPYFTEKKIPTSYSRSV